MDSTVVDRLHTDFPGLFAVLDTTDEVSLRSVADEKFRKALLVAAASYFEQHMTDAVLNFVTEVTAEGHALTWLVRNKAVSCQYHTWFNLEQKNANSFFGLFGNAFQDHMKAVMIVGNHDLGSSIPFERFWRSGARETVLFMEIMVASYLVPGGVSIKPGHRKNQEGSAGVSPASVAS